MAIILCSSLALLRALRLQTRWAWAWYAIASIVGLYSHIFHLLILFSQGFYVLLVPTGTRAQRLRGYGSAAVVSLAVFAPWIAIIATQVETVSEKTVWIRSSQVSFQAIARSWFRTLSQLFVDVNSVPLPKIVAIVLYYGLPILGLYALYFLIRKTPKRTSLLLYVTIAGSIIPLYLLNLVSSNRALVTPRYSIPAYLALQLAIVFLLAWKATERRPTIWQRWWRLGWQLALAGLLVIGCCSSVAIGKSTTPWTKGLSAVNWPIAKTINQTRSSLMIDCERGINYPVILSLSHLLEPTIAILMAPVNAPCDPDTPALRQLQQQYNRIFLYFPPADVLRDLEARDGLDIVTLKSSHRGEVWLAEVKPYNQN